MYYMYCTEFRVFAVKRQGSFAKMKNAIERKRTAESDPRELIYQYPKGLKPDQLEPYKVMNIRKF